MQICGLELEEIPHCDTINDVFKKVNVEEIKKEIILQQLARYKIRGDYYHVIIDRTGLATSREKYSKIGSEFVDNEEKNIGKQDCKIKTFKELTEKIKREYPRLKIMISGGALHSCKPVVDICNGNNQIIRIKEGSIPNLYKDFEILVEPENESKKENYQIVTKLYYQGNKRNKKI